MNTMKTKILTAVIAIVFVISAQAQHNHKRPQKPKFTPEQHATLMLKKMTLALDLTDSQQKKLKPIITEGAKKRHEMMEKRKENRGKKPQISSEEAYKKANQQLDYKIAMKKKVKAILNKDQYEKWEKIQAHRNHKKEKMKKGMHAKKKKRQMQPENN